MGTRRHRAARLAGIAASAGIAFGLAAAAPAAAADTGWVQHDAAGVSIRVATDAAACPAVVVDGVATATVERAAPDAGFPQRVCSLAVPAGARAATLAGTALPLPDGKVDRIVVIGDTGCRIKGERAQACDDPAAWPFARIAAAAAALDPDLVVHVGDYLYRESPCPPDATGCAGSPHGDDAATWSADFFAPAAPLLAAAPWVMVRGNHEICERAGRGWTRFLGPWPWIGPCAVHEPAYRVDIGEPSLAVLDAAAAPDETVDPTILAALAPEISALSVEAQARPTWLAIHKPMYSIVRDDAGRGIGVSVTLAAAAAGQLPKALGLSLSGHVHQFQALAFTDGEPPQLVVGNSGTALDVDLPADLSGVTVGGLTVTRGLEVHDFGFLVLERAEGGGWDGRLLDPDGRPLATCTLDPGVLACSEAR